MIRRRWHGVPMHIGLVFGVTAPRLMCARELAPAVVVLPRFAILGMFACRSIEG